MLIRLAIGVIDPIRRRQPSHQRGIFGNILDEAMRP
jgi:hypothetical protein